MSTNNKKMYRCVRCGKRTNLKPLDYCEKCTPKELDIIYNALRKEHEFAGHKIESISEFKMGIEDSIYHNAPARRKIKKGMDNA